MLRVGKVPVPGWSWGDLGEEATPGRQLLAFRCLAWCCTCNIQGSDQVFSALWVSGIEVKHLIYLVVVLH